jgi:hypothetical protein
VVPSTKDWQIRCMPGSFLTKFTPREIVKQCRSNGGRAAVQVILQWFLLRSVNKTEYFYETCSPLNLDKFAHPAEAM